MYLKPIFIPCDVVDLPWQVFMAINNVLIYATCSKKELIINLMKKKSGVCFSKCNFVSLLQQHFYFYNTKNNCVTRFVYACKPLFFLLFHCVFLNVCVFLDWYKTFHDTDNHTVKQCSIFKLIQVAFCPIECS